MDSKQWEDICIIFDEYGMQPATLCDNAEEVINNFRKAFREVLKDLKVLDIFKEQLFIRVYKAYYNDKPMCFLKIFEADIFITTEIYNKLKEWLEK